MESVSSAGFSHTFLKSDLICICLMRWCSLQMLVLCVPKDIKLLTHFSCCKRQFALKLNQSLISNIVLPKLETQNDKLFKGDSALFLTMICRVLLLSRTICTVPRVFLERGFVCSSSYLRLKASSAPLRQVYPENLSQWLAQSAQDLLKISGC